MTRKNTDTKDVIEYVDRHGSEVRVVRQPAYSAIPTEVIITAGRYGRSPPLSLKQTRVIAERMLQWCDDAEKKR